MKTKFLIPLLAGLGLLCACKGTRSGESDDSSTIASGNAKSVLRRSDTSQNNPKLVKTADMHFQVKSVRQTAEQITALTESYNGTVMHHLMRSIPGDSVDIRKNDDSITRVTIINSTAEMTVKIPPANMESFMNRVALLGIQVNEQRMDITDKSLDYLSKRMKLKNQNDLVDQQKKAGANKKDPDDLLAFKNNMVDQQISNRRTDDSAKSSVVTLSFYDRNTVVKKTMANNDLSTYKEPLAKRLGTSFENGWSIFVDILAGLANFWVLAPIGFGVWMAVRYYKLRKIATPAKN